jgi:hypothetical protein
MPSREPARKASSLDDQAAENGPTLSAEKWISGGLYVSENVTLCYMVSGDV